MTGVIIFWRYCDGARLSSDVDKESICDVRFSFESESKKVQWPIDHWFVLLQMIVITILNVIGAEISKPHLAAAQSLVVPWIGLIAGKSKKRRFFICWIIAARSVEFLSFI